MDKTRRIHEDSFLEVIASIQSRIATLQSATVGKFVLFTHDPTGLGGQISRRILAIRVALITGRTAAFVGEDFYPYDNAFEPLTHVEIDDEDAVTVDLANLKDDKHPVVRFDFWKFWHSDEALKLSVYRFLPEELFGIENGGILLDGIIFSTFRLKPAYEQFVSKSRHFIDTMRPVIGVHFRRGDKYVEAPYVPAEIYRRAADNSACASPQNIFLSSDSPLALKELGLDPAQYNVYFDVEEKRYNNANHRFLMKNRDLAQQETLSAIKNIYLLGYCDKITGQSNSQFARLAAAQIMVARRTFDFGELIEPITVPRTFTARALYILYRQARRLAKSVLVFRQLKHTKKSY